MVEIKSGIEIHQQLDTHKLFCECPSILRNENPLFEVKRKLHAVKGETGEVDAAAKHEAERDREFIYQSYDTTCLVELDEEPPHMINKEALKIGLHIAMHLNSEILPITQIMRKTVVDGSNTSGFQRTLIIARNGYVETKYGRVGIKGVFLEEDAARIVGSKDDDEVLENGKVTYRLDRLGIPLVEIATEPDIKSAEQCKEVALYLGDIIRSCKVRRGIGTIRQDVNISITGHPRIEIKGFQDPKTFIDTFNNEVKRQEEMIKIHEELKKKKSKVSDKIVDLTEIFRNSESKILRKVIDNNGKVLGFKLIQFSSLLGREFYPGRRFGSEISDYAKTSGVNGIIHSDEDLSKYHISNSEVDSIKNTLEINEGDSFIIVADSEEKAKHALGYAIKRAKIQLESSGVSEVRKDNPDSGTRFLRPIPGSARMYPETDLPILRITREIINEAKETIPRLRSEFRDDLRGKGLSEEMVKLFSHGDKLEEFEALLKIINEPNFIAKVLFLIPKEIASHEKMENIDDVLNLDIIESIVSLVATNKISKEDVKHVMEEIAKGKRFEDAIKLEKIDLSDIEGEIARIVKEKPNLSISGYMGLIMQKFKGKISGKDATDILNRITKI